MTYRGTVRNGVIRVEGGVRLPEGTEVQIDLADAPVSPTDGNGEPTIGQ
jgi:hypothetical protein